MHFIENLSHFASKSHSCAMHIITVQLRLRLHGVMYRPDSFEMMLRYCANLKAIRHESTSLNGILYLRVFKSKTAWCIIYSMI